MKLSYDAEQDIWICPVLWMSDATFKRYVDVWFHGKPTPTRAQLLEVVERCRKESYWIRGVDPDIHWLA